VLEFSQAPKHATAGKLRVLRGGHALMDYYDFAVTYFYIRGTRAMSNDTLWLSHTASVDGDVVASTLFRLGDFRQQAGYDPQNYVPAGSGPGLIGVVINDPEAKVGFAFQLLNAGNVSGDAMNGRVASTADQLAGIVAGLSGAGATGVAAALGAPAFAIGLGLEAFANLYTWLTVNCDGPVAVDQLSGPKYLLDAWLDNQAGQLVFNRIYPGTDSPSGCNFVNSNYEVTWVVRHYRGWGAVANPTDGQLTSSTGVSAAVHKGALHLLGAQDYRIVSHGRTFTGAAWSVDTVGEFELEPNLSVTAISHNDRLSVFGVKAGGSPTYLAYTEDGGSWTIEETPVAGAAFTVTQPLAATRFQNRLWLFAREQGGSLNASSSADLALWSPWTVVPPAGLAPTGPVAAVSLHGVLHLFGIYLTRKPPETAVVVHNSSADGATWSGWEMVETARPNLAANPLDVAATVWRDRIYIASQWQYAQSGGQEVNFMAVTFSADGSNWSGWRTPESTIDFQTMAPAGIAALGRHLYVATLIAGPFTPSGAEVHVH
jgi:hypothetical protein